MKKAMKFPNIKALAAAFANGELDKKKWTLILDNDCAFLSYTGETPKGEDEYCYRDKMNDEARKWYRGNGYADLADAVEAAGIPCEWC